MDFKDLGPDTLSTFADHDAHERIRRIEDPATGLVAFIGVHNRNLGPALGGCRMRPYETEAEAIRDVLRLSRGMTYKNALAGLPLGGGKAVIIGDPFRTKTPALMQAMGRAVETLKGDYITAEDSGTGEADMEAIATQTKHVVGMVKAGSELGGNPSPVTAWGVYNGIKAAVRKRYGSEDMKGLRVAVQGLGAVGHGVCRLLHKDGAELIVTDVRQAVLDEIQVELKGTKVVAPDDIFAVEADVFSPCALGAQLNEKTIPQMMVEIIAGAANNQMATPADEDRVADKNILYVPDYVINAGGVIAVAYELFENVGTNPYPYKLTRQAMMDHVGQIGQTIEKILALAEAQGITTGRAADRVAESIFMHREKSTGTH